MTRYALPQRVSVRLLLTVILGTILYMSYLLVFSGDIISDDERFIIDTADTLAIQHDPYLNQTTYLRGLQRTDVEPALPVLAAPLYWLAYHIPWIGTIHGTLLFNPIITALTALVLFYFVLDLGYSRLIAVWIGLLYGLTTIAVPYARTFFREPLATLGLIAAAYAFHRWRGAFMSGKRHWPWIVIGLIITIVALLTKEAALIALPGILLFAYPGGKFIRDNLKVVVIALGVLIALAVAFALGLALIRDAWVILDSRYQVLTRLGSLWMGLSGAWYGMVGYLITPGKGIWLFSPIAVLALASPFVTDHKRWRITYLPLALTLWFALCYAAIRREIWYGGADWGSRYMVPVIPFLMLGVAPVLDRILTSEKRWLRVIPIGLGIFGLFVQIGASAVNIHEYYGHLQATTGQPPWGHTGTWYPHWSQAIGHILYLPKARANIMWFIPDPDVLSLIVMGVVTLALVIALWWLIRTRHDQANPYHRLILLSPLLAVVVTLFVLSRNYTDPRYRGGDQELHALRQRLEATVQRDDLIFLSSPNYVLFFMNYYKGAATWYSLPLAPGERYSPDQEIPSDDLNDMVTRDIISIATLGMFGRILDTGHPIWLVVDHSSYIPWATRPAEWYLSRYSFPVQAEDIGASVRLVEYIPVLAPTSREPSLTDDLLLGEHIHLIGHDLVGRRPEFSPEKVTPGSMIGVSLYWQTTAPLDQDYISALFLVDSSGTVIAQQDRPPQGGFRPTTSWQTDEVIRDNFGMFLPDDLPSGTYEIWAILYTWPSLERLPVTTPDGVSLGDHVILDTIEVKP